MSTRSRDSDWLDPHGTVSAAELARMCQLSVSELEELVDYGLLQPVAGAPRSRIFSGASVQPLREAAALRNLFDLDLFVVGLMFCQLERVAQLEQQVRSLHAHLRRPRPERDGPAPWREPHD